jgi:hypothetical protein
LTFAFSSSLAALARPITASSAGLERERFLQRGADRLLAADPPAFRRDDQGRVLVVDVDERVDVTGVQRLR